MIKQILFATFALATLKYTCAQELVKNIDPQKSYDHIKKIVAGKNGLFFIANDSIHGHELWISQGTAAGTKMVKDINPGTASAWNEFSGYNMVALGDNVIFNANDGTNGEELWISDGSLSGTKMLKDIHPAAGSGAPRYFYVFKDTLFFSAYDNVNGYELWKSDGTTNGTVLVKKISTKTGASNASSPSGFTSYKGELYFIANDRSAGPQIWKTNGTEAGTVKVSNANSPNGLYPNELFVAGDLLYFRANNGSGDIELWKCDGTESGTQLVKNINPTGSSNPSFFGELNGKLFFKANNGTNGEELWISDGTDAGTTLLKDINTGSAHSMSLHYQFAKYKNELYFTARGTGENAEIWKTNGTPSGTVKASNLAGSGNSSPGSYFVYGNTLYFNAIYGADGANAYELFKTDGTVAGTKLTKNIQTIPNGNAGIGYLTLYNGDLYYSARDSANGEELWRLKNAITYSEETEIQVCDSFIFDNNIYKNSGTYTRYTPNSIGYDSAITIKLNVFPIPVIELIGDSLVAPASGSYQWQLNGNNIEGATQRKIKPTQNGNYRVIFSKGIKKGVVCTKTSLPLTLSAVNITSLQNTGFSLYPNPAGNRVYINTSTDYSGLKIKLMSINGQLIAEKALSADNSYLSLEGIQPGLYWVQLYDGNTSKVLRLIIQ